MSFPRYQAYKDSGVEWLGEVPVHWETHPFKWEIKRNDGGVWGLDPDGLDDTIVLRSTEQTIDGKWRLDDPAFRKLTHVERNTTLLEEGDLVVTKSSGSSAHIGKTTIVGAELASMGCCFSNFMQRIRLQPGFHPRLAWYAMNNELMRKQFDYFSNTTTGLANLNATLIGMAMVPVPTNGEQKQIVAFLDRETAKIDVLITEQQHLIELLQEKRQAVISHAVTKGLNPGAPMKDSGVEWLGEVPEHWEVKRLKQITSQISVGIVVEPSKYYDDSGSVPALRSLNVKSGRIDLCDCVYISSESNHLLRKSVLRSGDLVIVRSGQPGTCAVIPEELDECNCIDLIFLRSPEHGSSQYLTHQLSSESARYQYGAGVEGAIQQHFNVKTASELIIAWPPLREQDEICHYLSVRISEIDSLSECAERSVSLLQERRSALISAAVTGQIDVRGLVPEASAE
jgi:type I restriction enzyme S subunit